MRMRRQAAPTAALARKPAPGKRPRVMDRSLERQAEEATQAALHGQVDVARVLTPAPAAKVELPASTSAPLATDVRADAERVFGAELSAVRIHRDPTAAAAAEREDAHAFTAGTDVFFAEGQYDPAGQPGRALLYHELAHVLQQTGRRQSPTRVRATPQAGSGSPQAGGGKRHG